MKQIFMMYWIEMMILLHLVFCTISLYDLFSEPTMQRKIPKACLILLLPVFGIRMVEAKRKLQSHGDVTTTYNHTREMPDRGYDSWKAPMPSVDNSQI